MSQIFLRPFNIYSKLSIVVTAVLVGGLSIIIFGMSWTGYVTGQGVTRDQPIQFSHAHHVGSMGIDCRYCHSTVEESAFANIPPTKTCMNCHSQIWTNAPILEPVRASFRDNRPLTTCALTAAGKKAFTNYINLLENIIQQTRNK